MNSENNTGEFYTAAKSGRTGRDQRNVGIEFLRILACLMVFAIHVGLPDWYSAHARETGPVFLSCLIADAVGIFWLVTGCFLAQHFSYRKRLKDLLLKIVIPMLLYFAFSYYFYGSIVYGAALQESAAHSAEEYRALLSSVTAWSTPPVGAAWHLWFLYTYILIILISPLLKKICDLMDCSRGLECLVLLASFLFFAANDFSLNQLGKIALTGGWALLPSVCFVLTGHVLYRHRAKLLSGKFLVGSIALLAADELLRTKVISSIYAAGVQNPTPVYWYSSFGLVGAVCIFIICLSVFRSVRPEKGIGHGIIRIASYTFPVYILSQFVIDFLIQKGLSEQVMNLISPFLGVTSFVLLYRIILAAVCFAVTLLISWIISRGFSWHIKGQPNA